MLLGWSAFAEEIPARNKASLPGSTVRVSRQIGSIPGRNLEDSSRNPFLYPISEDRRKTTQSINQSIIDRHGQMSLNQVDSRKFP